MFLIQRSLALRMQRAGRMSYASLPSPHFAHTTGEQRPFVRTYVASETATTDKVGPLISYSIQRRNGSSASATITISNPLKLNVVNGEMLKQLCDVCGQLSNDESLGVVVLTGGRTASGKSPSFVGGADIKEMHAITSSLEAKIFITQIHNACQALRDLPVPVIARVNGFALGAGLEIMAACDLRIATQNSIFGMPEVKIGLPSVVEAALLPGLIGMGRARRLMYLAENISAEIAEGWGLIERVVTDEAALNEAIDEWSATIAGMGPKAMTTQKRLMQEWERSFTPNSIMAGIHAFERTFDDGGREPKKFMQAFLDRRR